MTEALDLDPADAERRIRLLCDKGQTVEAIVRTATTEARAFYATVRMWKHPSEPGMRILNVQNAQLAAGWSDMSDTFMSGSGFRQRVPADSGDVARALAQGLAATAARQDANALGDRGTEYRDATEGSEE
jgi:hypothetical protein